jgi:hypothetical protein
VLYAGMRVLESAVVVVIGQMTLDYSIHWLKCH